MSLSSMTPPWRKQPPPHKSQQGTRDIYELQEGDSRPTFALDKLGASYRCGITEVLVFALKKLSIFTHWQMKESCVGHSSWHLFEFTIGGCFPFFPITPGLNIEGTSFYSVSVILSRYHVCTSSVLCRTYLFAGSIGG